MKVPLMLDLVVLRLSVAESRCPRQDDRRDLTIGRYYLVVGPCRDGI